MEELEETSKPSSDMTEMLKLSGENSKTILSNMLRSLMYKLNNKQEHVGDVIREIERRQTDIL